MGRVKPSCRGAHVQAATRAQCARMLSAQDYSTQQEPPQQQCIRRCYYTTSAMLRLKTIWPMLATTYMICMKKKSSALASRGRSAVTPFLHARRHQ